VKPVKFVDAVRRARAAVFPKDDRVQTNSDAHLAAGAGFMSTSLDTSCPHCRSIDFRKVGTRGPWEESFSWLLQPFRCGLCGHPFYLFLWQTPIDA
jgi:hypothetical protein